MGRAIFGAENFPLKGVFTGIRDTVTKKGKATQVADMTSADGEDVTIWPWAGITAFQGIDHGTPITVTVQGDGFDAAYTVARDTSPAATKMAGNLASRPREQEFSIEQTEALWGKAAFVADQVMKGKDSPEAYGRIVSSIATFMGYHCVPGEFASADDGPGEPPPDPDIPF